MSYSFGHFDVLISFLDLEIIEHLWEESVQTQTRECWRVGVLWHQSVCPRGHEDGRFPGSPATTVDCGRSVS